MAKTLRYLGFCPCCARDIKVRTGSLVHHGYERPGWGHIVGDCYGALRTPHETSDELAKEYLGVVEHSLESTKTDLANLEAATELSVEVFDKYVGRRASYKRVMVPKATRPEGGFDWENDREGALAAHKAVEAWERAYNSRKRNLKSRITQLQREVERLTELVDTWKETPLREVLEEKAAKKAAREAARRAKKDARVKTEVTKFQKRIDTALRTKNSNTLAEIWDRAQSKLREVDSDLTKEAALTLLDRNEVWEAFGLGGMTSPGWKKYSREEGPSDPILTRMKDRMDRIKGRHRNFYRNNEWERNHLNAMTLEWPEALGGENKKGAKTLAEVKALLERHS